MTTTDPRMCSIDGCSRPHVARGWCHTHYARWKHHGSPHIISHARHSGSSEERFWAKVNKAGSIPIHAPELGPCWEWQASTTTSGYGTFHKDTESHAVAHRISWEFINGALDCNIQLDHRCHNRACVNPAHLRPATNKQNGENRTGAQRNSTSGIRGVSRSSRDKRWKAEVTHEGKKYWVGHFIDIAEAEAAVIAKRNELFTHNDLDRVRAA